MLFSFIYIHPDKLSEKNPYTVICSLCRFLQLTTMPLTCPRSTVAIDLRESPVSMCTCANVWLKALDGQRGSVHMDDTTLHCGDANTTDDLLQMQCQRPETSNALTFDYYIFSCAYACSLCIGRNAPSVFN